ncbi:MAG: ANTAR domain-containing protein [Clostridiales bacterium]|nr:ANTAR domain-containing protein [Clostridiales bacterium]
MEATQRVYSVLLVSSSEKFNTSLSALLQGSRFDPVRAVESIGSAQREILERSYDIVLVNSPLPDEVGIEFAIDVCSGSSAAALMFLKSDMYGEIYPKVTRHGVLTLQKPTSSQMVSHALSWLCAVRERLRRLEKKTVSAQEKLEEIRFVNRAKWLLIEELKMTETDAHRYIEKQAMDQCISKKKVAERIIKTYGS